MDSAERRRRWQVVLPHRQYLVRIAVSRGMSRDDAEDCAQEAMVRCVGFANLDETRVVEFLATTTARLCVDRHRLHVRDAKVGVRLVPWYVDEPSPEEATCDRSEASWVASHVAALPESQRAALTAKADGLTCQEIAARMGLSYKAVESLLSRARAYVRAAVATAWVLVARARRRGLDLPEGVPAMTMAALVTVAAFVPGGPVSPAGNAATPAPSRARAAVAAAPAPVRPVAPPAQGRPRVHPAGVRPSVAPPPYVAALTASPVLPIPAPAVPTDPCDARVPHVDACVPVNSYRPGDGLQDCLADGVQVTPRGVVCRPS
ncbi:MAG: hypothetical protein QOE45_2738 [Frankiaceae bacterium]|nr:hypothetical protein [Frankiaceae bacterium]